MTTSAAAAGGTTTTAPARPARRAVAAYVALSQQVRASGLLERRRAYYAVRMALTGTALALVVAGLVLVGDSWWALTLAPALALVTTQVAFLGHDAAHRQVFASDRANDVTSRVLASLVAGLSIGWWRGKHDAHHAKPNQVGADTDIESKVLAFHEAAARKPSRLHTWLLRHQGFWFFPLLLLEGFNLHVDSWTAVLRRRGPRGRGADLALIVAHWVLLAGLLLVVLSPGKALAFVAVALACFGVFLGGAFAPNHTGMPVAERGTRMDFLHRQVLASRNVRGGWWVDFAMGGLNRQVEHHLFPSMPRPNLKRVQPVVRAFCAEHGIAYTETSFPGAYLAVVRYLNDVGLGARRARNCPLAAQFRG
ncbi:acyl-CoA desaturase [Kineococcus sp. SYSU DK004]|uniref:acyl-CoA desaturase n=1 Tax=Kineococcus sp. SYSU DK004 TaxID=3383125 RepID=UPI003D7D7503